MGAPKQARGFAARRTAFKLVSVHAAREFLARRAANAALRLVDTRLGGASNRAPLSLAFLHPAGAATPVQHVRNVTQHVQHLHLLQQVIHRLTLRVEQHGALHRSPRPRVPARLTVLRERVVETVRMMRDRSARRDIERLICDRFARRDVERLTRDRSAERNIERLMHERFTEPAIERLTQTRFASRNTRRFTRVRFATPNIAGVTRNHFARRDFERLARDRFTQLDFERLARVRLTGRDLQRLPIDRSPALRTSTMTLHSIVAPLVTDTTATVLQRYGVAQPLASAFTLRHASHAQPRDIKREIERIERTVQTKVVREIMHQGHQQQQIRTAVSDALLSRKLVQTLARQIQTTLEQRANVERYRKGGR